LLYAITSTANNATFPSPTDIIVKPIVNQILQPDDNKIKVPLAQLNVNSRFALTPFYVSECRVCATIACATMASVVCATIASVVCATMASVVCATIACATMVSVVCATIASVVCATMQVSCVQRNSRLDSFVQQVSSALT
jgi:hypothetical protein